MKLKNLFKKVATAVMAVAMTAGVITAPVNAAPMIPDSGNLHIHVFNLPDLDEAGLPNDGTEATVPESATPLEGITFKVYKLDTTDKYPESGECTVDSIDATTKVTDTEGNEFDVTLAQTVTSNAEGLASALDLAKGVYLVVEQENEKVARPSAPYIVAVPMTTSTGDGWITDVHTYPKSNDISITKAVDRTSVSVGEVVTWTLYPTAGSATEGCYKYDVTDELDTALDFVDGSVIVNGVNGTTETLIANTNYTVTVDANNKLTVSFNAAGRLLLPSYEKLKIDFKTKTNSEILERVNYTVYNQGVVELNNKYAQDKRRESNIVKIHTAAINVFKTDPKTNPLAGAEFTVATSEDNAKNENYLRIDADGNIYDYGEAGYDSASVWTVTTGADGYAKFEGLRDYDLDGNYLTYYLTETKAPEGFSLLGVPVSAEFSAETSQEATAYTIEVNIQDEKIPELPATGGNGTWMYTALAIAFAMAGLLVALISQKKKETSK